MNSAEATEILSEIDFFALASNMEIPDNIMPMMQYLPAGFAAYNAQKYKEAESYFAAVLIAINNLKEQDPATVLIEPIVNLMLGNAMRMQGRNRQAFGLYSYVVSLGTDTEKRSLIKELGGISIKQIGLKALFIKPLLALLTGSGLDEVVSDAYLYLAESAFSVSGIKFVEIGEIIEEGLRFLSDINHTEWEASLRLERALLWLAQGKIDEALREVEVSLSLRRRQKDYAGYALWVFINNLAYLQNIKEKHTDAIQTEQEILKDQKKPTNAKCDAFINLAISFSELGNINTARDFAEKAISLFDGDKTQRRTASAYATLAYVIAKGGDVSKAVSEVSQAWCIIRHNQSLTPLYPIRCLEVRLAQLQNIANSKSINQDSQDQAKVVHLWQSTLRWLAYAQKITKEYVSRGGGYPFTKMLSEIESKANVLASNLYLSN